MVVVVGDSGAQVVVGELVMPAWPWCVGNDQDLTHTHDMYNIRP